MVCYDRWSYGNYLEHHGIMGMKWGIQNGPPYPLSYADHSAAEKRLAKLSKKATKLEEKSAKYLVKAGKAAKKENSSKSGKAMIVSGKASGKVAKLEKKAAKISAKEAKKEFLAARKEALYAKGASFMTKANNDSEGSKAVKLKQDKATRDAYERYKDAIEEGASFVRMYGKDFEVDSKGNVKLKDRFITNSRAASSISRKKGKGIIIGNLLAGPIGLAIGAAVGYKKDMEDLEKYIENAKKDLRKKQNDKYEKQEN